MSKKLAGFSSPKRIAPSPPPPASNGAAKEARLRAFVGGDEMHESRYKRQGPGERIGVYMAPELVRAVKRAALEQDRSVTDALTEAVKDWLAKVRV
jgi:hypothetical protein